MYEYLTDHALKNAWCNHEQDNQLIFNAKRITKTSGELNTFKLMGRTAALPTTKTRYHVFQVGQLFPKVVGLLPSTPGWVVEKWYRFSEAINSKSVFVNIYTTEGVELARSQCYYMYSNDHALIFAFPDDKNFSISYSSEIIYVRLYSNAWFDSAKANSTGATIHCEGGTPINNTEILAIQNKYESYAAMPGHTFAYCNGFLINAVNLINVKPKDTVEFIYDSSVKRVVTHRIKDLLMFRSDLDSRYKYLLHRNVKSDNCIDFLDDTDIHIIFTSTGGRYKGYYYHRNLKDAQRMVTHVDYSLPVDYVKATATSLQTALKTTTLIEDFSLQVVVRESGLDRPLIYDNDRIFELYKLSYEKSLAAMTDLESSAYVWRAENLENSAYTQLMREDYKGVTIDLIEKGYGYNSLSKIVADTPQTLTVNDSELSAKLPYLLAIDSTVYEYDANGIMLEKHHNEGIDTYRARNPQAHLIEALVGEGTYYPDVRFGMNNVPIPFIDSYRVYRAYKYDGEAIEPWENITGTDEYVVVNNAVQWAVDEGDRMFMVRTDKTFLAYDLTITPQSGVLYFTLSENEDRGDGILNYALPVPLGNLELFLNGRSLIQGLDYIVKFPTVYIVNKSWLNQPSSTANQHIHVRYSGFDDTPSGTYSKDFGYIEHGFMSNNNKFDLRDDKVLRVILNGAVITRDDITFSELHDGVSVANPINGQPYLVSDVLVPLKDMVSSNTYPLKAKARVVDTIVSDYLSLKLPQPPREAPSAIPTLHDLYSPFFSHIIHDLFNDLIDNSVLDIVLTDEAVIGICKKYEYLLSFDPLNDLSKINAGYVLVNPHSFNGVLDIKLFQYRFLTRVVALYGKDRIALSPSVALQA